MAITFSKISNVTSRKGIILRGKAMAQQAIEEHLRGCGNNILQPSTLGRSSLLSMDQATFNLTVPSVPASSVWRLLEQRGKTNFLTLHQQLGPCSVEIDWFDQATEIACLKITHKPQEGINLEQSLAVRGDWQRAIFDATLGMFFDPTVVGNGKYSLDLSELLNPFPLLNGFEIADPLSLAKACADWSKRTVPDSPKVATHQTKDLHIKILFPLMDDKDFSVQQTMLMFYLITQNNLDFAQGNIRAAAAQFMMSLCNLALGAQEGFRVEFNIEKGSDEQPRLIWQKEEMALVQRAADQIEAAYRPFVRG